jgi:hypothetical protein
VHLNLVLMGESAVAEGISTDERDLCGRLFECTKVMKSDFGPERAMFNCIPVDDASLFKIVVHCGSLFKLGIG